MTRAPPPPRTRRGLLAAALVAAAPVVYGFLSTEFRGPGIPDGSAIDIRVPAGFSSRQIARLLEAEELIFHARIFDTYVRLRGAARVLKAGRYEIPRGASYAYLLKVLRDGAVATTPLTIPEGLRVEAVAERIAEYTGEAPRSRATSSPRRTASRKGSGSRRS